MYINICYYLYIHIGKPPDFIAFSITLIMTSVLAMGASKSVIFNHALNAINLATWVFVMTAGLFYVDTNTWTEHQGFLPYGWSGVSTSSAICGCYALQGCKPNTICVHYRYSLVQPRVFMHLLASIL